MVVKSAIHFIVLCPTVPQTSFLIHFNVLWSVDIDRRRPAHMRILSQTALLKEHAKNRCEADSFGSEHKLHLWSIYRKCSLSFVNSLSLIASHVILFEVLINALSLIITSIEGQTMLHIELMQQLGREICVIVQVITSTICRALVKHSYSSSSYHVNSKCTRDSNLSSTWVMMLIMLIVPHKNIDYWMSKKK